MSKNRSPSAGSGSASSPRLATRPSPSRSGSRISYRITPRPRWPPAAWPAAGRVEGVRAHPVQPRQLGQRGEPAPGRDPSLLQRPPRPGRHPRHQRQVVVGSPALAAHIAPPADGAVLDRLRVDLGRRIPADGALKQPPRLPLVSGVVVHLEREELAVAERQAHPPRRYRLHVGQQMRVERGLQHRAGLRRPRQLGVHDLVVHPARPRLPVRRGSRSARTRKSGRPNSAAPARLRSASPGRRPRPRPGWLLLSLRPRPAPR